MYSASLIAVAVSSAYNLAVITLGFLVKLSVLRVDDNFKEYEGSMEFQEV